MATPPSIKNVSRKYEHLFDAEHWGDAKAPNPANLYSGQLVVPGSKSKATAFINKNVPAILKTGISGERMSSGRTIDPNLSTIIGKYSIVLYEAEIIRASATWHVSRFNKELLGEDDQNEGWRNYRMNLSPKELISESARMSRIVAINQRDAAADKRSAPLTLNFEGAPGEVSFIGENSESGNLQRYIRVAGLLIALPTVLKKLTYYETAPVIKKRECRLDNPIRLITNPDNEVLRNSSRVGETNYRHSIDTTGKDQMVSRIISAAVYQPWNFR